MRNLLVVTGASGFVGRHLVGAAVSAGWTVRGLARSGTRARTVIEGVFRV